MTYTFLKLLHLLAVFIFMGNVITGIFWMYWAVKTREFRIIHHAIDGVIHSDYYFTIPGAVVITVTGIMMAVYGSLPVMQMGWIYWTAILFVISGVVYFVRVVPLQRRIKKLTTSIQNISEWKQLYKLYRSWDVWGIISVVASLAAFVLMIIKVPV